MSTSTSTAMNASMDIPAFLRSEHGRGIGQGKLYRRLRAFVEEKAEGRAQGWAEGRVGSLPLKKDFYDEGFRVEEDARGQFRYLVYDAERFRRFALEEAGWAQPTEEEARVLLKAARQLVRMLYGADAEWGVVPRAEAERFYEARRAARGEAGGFFGALVAAAGERLSGREKLAARLTQITARCMPPEE